MTLRHSSDVQGWLSQHDPLSVVPWRDPVVEAAGYEARSDYVERYWLSLLGPSALLAARRLVAGLEETPGGFSVPLGPFAGQLGLGTGTGRNSPVVRSLARLAAFKMATNESGVYAVRLAFPPMARRHLLRLPEHLAEAHRLEMERAWGSPAARTTAVALRC